MKLSSKRSGDILMDSDAWRLAKEKDEKVEKKNIRNNNIMNDSDDSNANNSVEMNIPNETENIAEDMIHFGNDCIF